MRTQADDKFNEAAERLAARGRQIGAREMLEMLEVCGMTFSLNAGRLWVGPEESLSDLVRAAIGRHREGIVHWLKMRKPHAAGDGAMTEPRVSAAVERTPLEASRNGALALNGKHRAAI